MILIELSEQILCILAFCVAVHRALALYDRKIILVPETDHIHLVNEHQRADHCQVHPVQVGLGRERVKPALKDQRQEHCLNDIVLVMRVSDLITAHFLDSLIQCTFAHFRTERAGIRLFTDIEQDIIDL